MSAHDIDPKLRFLVRFFHPEKSLPPLPGVDAGLAGRLLGLDPAAYEAIVADVDADTHTAAQALVDEAATAAAIDRVRVSAGGAIVGLGDSLTDDRNSWLEILSRAFALRRPQDGIRFVNAGVSGESPVQMLPRMPIVAAARPEWIVCLAGTNDARLFGDSRTGPVLPPGTTLSALKALQGYAARETRARWLWATPLGADEALADANWFWQSMQTHWSNAALMAVADGIMAFGEPAVDLRDVVGRPVNRQLLLDDGIHPNVDGQKAIARAVVEAMAAT